MGSGLDDAKVLLMVVPDGLGEGVFARLDIDDFSGDDHDEDRRDREWKGVMGEREVKRGK